MLEKFINVWSGQRFPAIDILGQRLTLPFIENRRAYPFFFPANGLFALPALIAAHRFRAASAIALRPAALSLCLRCTGIGWRTEDPGFDELLGGRPRRVVGPCRASIARDTRSRSATSKATICSVCIS